MTNNNKRITEEEQNPFQKRQHMLRLVSLTAILAVVISGMGIALLSL